MMNDSQLSFLATTLEGDDPPITVIREIRVRQGQREAFERSMQTLIEAATRQPGHLGATIVRPHGERESYRFVYKFDRRSALERWHDSPERARLFEPVMPLIESEHVAHYPGLATWFDLPSIASPPKWKTTLLSWLAIYPLVTLGIYMMKWTGFAPPIPISALILTAVIVPLVAFIVAPWLGRLLHGWLFPQGVSS